MSEEVRRAEFVFAYDVKDANPNGDPAEGNRPRMDDYTEQNIVSDVRIKRTARDYVDRKYRGEKGMEVFIKEHRNENGDLKTKKEIVEELLTKISKETGSEKHSLEDIKRYILENYWDLRTFGALIDKVSKEFLEKPPSGDKEASITVTGPVQIRFGRSVHKVEPELVSGTTVMPSGEGKARGTMPEYWKVPYSLIATYGVVNNHVAQEVGLKRRDLGVLWEALWNGTAELNTRSKVGHTPRLLLIVEYEEDHHTGNLDYLIRMYKKGDNVEITARTDEQGLGKYIRGPDEYTLDLSGIFEELKGAKEKIRAIWIIKHPKLQIRYNHEELEDKVKVIETEYLHWNSEGLKEFRKAWDMGE